MAKKEKRKKFNKVLTLLNIGEIDLPETFYMGDSYLDRVLETYDTYVKVPSELKLSENDIIRNRLIKTLTEINSRRVLAMRKSKKPNKLINTPKPRETKEVILERLRNLVKAFKIQLLSQEFIYLRSEYLKARYNYIENSKVSGDVKKLLKILPDIIEIPNLKKLKAISHKHTQVKDLHKNFEGGEAMGEVLAIREHYQKKLHKLKDVDSESVSMTRALLNIKDNKIDARIKELKKRELNKREDYHTRKERELIDKINLFTNRIENYLI